MYRHRKHWICAKRKMLLCQAFVHFVHCAPALRIRALRLLPDPSTRTTRSDPSGFAHDLVCGSTQGFAQGVGTKEARGQAGVRRGCESYTLRGQRAKQV